MERNRPTNDSASDRAVDLTNACNRFTADRIAEGYLATSLPAGQERLMTVSHMAMRDNAEREAHHRRNGGTLRLLPGIVVRERDENGNLNILGVWRHAYIEGDSVNEFLDEADRFPKTDGSFAVVAQRTMGRIVVFAHPSDEVLSGQEDWIKIGC